MTRRAALLMCLALMTTSANAQAFISDGTGTGQATQNVTEFAPGHVIVQSSVTYSSFEMADPTHPLNQASGSCFGTMEINAGSIEGDGVCIFDGLEGDRVLMGWEARGLDAQGRVVGYWTVNNGVGLWAEASGGGTFVSSVNRANGAAINTIRGAITLR